MQCMPKHTIFITPQAILYYTILYVKSMFSEARVWTEVPGRYIHDNNVAACPSGVTLDDCKSLCEQEPLCDSLEQEAAELTH